MGHGHKAGHKKSHSMFNSGSFKRDFKHGFLATGDAIHHAGREVNSLGGPFKAVGEPLKMAGQIEKVTASGIDTIGAKNPGQRYKKNMNVSF